MVEAVLKNPGEEAPVHLAFETYPHPLEFLRSGGMPGVEYLYVLAENMPKAQQSHWAQIIGMPFFSVNGVAMTILARGKPIPYARPGAVRCKFYLDLDAPDKTNVLPWKNSSGPAPAVKSKTQRSD